MLPATIGMWGTSDMQAKTSYYHDPTTCMCDTTANFMGQEYRGSLNKTKYGLECQAWRAQEPHAHGYGPDSYDGQDANYCRNPDGEPTTWCTCYVYI